MKAKLKQFLSTSILLFSAVAFAEAPRVQKEWTLLLFLNGHNNLDEFGDLNINQMEKVGSNDQINLVVQWASERARNVKRLYVQRDNDANRVTSPVIQQMGMVDMGDVNEFVNFVKWGHDHYPAKKYFVAIWNHGSGWHMMNQNVGTRDISWDDFTGNSITTEQMRPAFAEIKSYIGHNIDLYGSDACLMNMMEVATEIENSADVMVGSEETEPGAGWPYDDLLRKWVAKPTATAAEVGTFLTDAYVESYSGGQNGNEEVTFSAVDLRKISDLNAKIKLYVSDLMSRGENVADEVQQALGNSQSFYYSDYVDLKDLIGQIASRTKTQNERTAVDLIAAINQVVIHKRSTDAYANANGIAVWGPNSSYYWSSNGDRYMALNFHQQTGWGNLLKLALGL